MPLPVFRSNVPPEGGRPRGRKAGNANKVAPLPRPRPPSRWWEQLWGNWFRLNLQAGEPVVHWRIVGVACGFTALTLLWVVQLISNPTPARIVVYQQDGSQYPIPEATVLPNPAADAREEERVGFANIDATSLEDLCLGGLDPTPDLDDDRPEGIPAAPSTLRTAEAPAAAGAEPAQPAKVIVKRRDLADDEELRKQLVQVTELNLASVPAKSRNIVASAAKSRKFTPLEIPDYAGLPLRMGVDCQIGKEPAHNLEFYSRKLRTALAPQRPSKNSRTLGDLREDANVLRTRLDEERSLWLKPEAIPALVQMLMAEDKAIRLVLIEYLARNSSPAATVALAQRALYDLAFQVREAAVEALRWRPKEEFRHVLLDGLRYPWAPVADHAAEALIAVNDRASVPALEKLLLEPDPGAPVVVYSQGRIAVRELVRVNHLGNCVMCHVSSTSANDPVRGRIPSPSEALPPAVEYYTSTGGAFVRADVTYLRQDFSVAQPVPRPGPWPANQRYDYLVRMRYLSGNEVASPVLKTFLGTETGPEARSKQKEAVLFALGELRPRWLALNSDKPY